MLPVQLARRGLGAVVVALRERLQPADQAEQAEMVQT